MATDYNAMLYIYKGVPLLKGGIEVLFESQDDAILALNGYIHRLYINYSYIRENRRYVRVMAHMQDIEGCNYIAFKNRSNGNKWFFGFIDQLVYINDNTVEIDFTIDPFPTYLGDAHFSEYGFVIRNTPLYDTIGNYLQEDYMPSSAKRTYDLIDHADFSTTNAFCYFAVSSNDLNFVPEILNPYNDAKTGIKVFPLTDTVLDAIQQYNGVIIGGYLCPDWYNASKGGYLMYTNLGTIGGNPFSNIRQYSNNKIYTGVYNTIILNTSQSTREYQLELFSDRNSVHFQCVGLMCPCPSIFVYPKNYKGVEHNLSEGVFVKFPAVPISANAVYTYAQQTSDNYSLIQNIVSSGLSGLASLAGAGNSQSLMQSGIGALANLDNAMIQSGLNIEKHSKMAQYCPPTVSGVGEPVVAVDGAIKIQLMVSRPSDTDLGRIDNFLTYYGYNISAEQTVSALGTNFNLSDGAYVQTGSDIIYGSEMDAQMNARLRAGVKIKRNLDPVQGE